MLFIPLGCQHVLLRKCFDSFLGYNSISCVVKFDMNIADIYLSAIVVNIIIST
jgi:hypothetical protein